MNKIRYGIFGGSFDPPHFGHLLLAEQARERYNLDCILFMLTPDPPHKEVMKMSPFSTRLEMLKSALENTPQAFEITMIENERPGPHYTADTIPLLRKRYPHVNDWYLLIGGDTAKQLRHWIRARELLEQVRVCVILRPGTHRNELMRALTAIALDGKPLCDDLLATAIIENSIMDSPQLDISSTDLRQRIQKQKTTRYLIPQKTRDIIDRFQLYQ